MTDVIVRMKHIRRARLCASGARDWFKHHGLPWQEFLDDGMSADRLEATGDTFALQVTKIARDEANDAR